MDVTVPTTVGNVVHVKICSLLACQSRAPHFVTAFFVCFLCPVLDFVKVFWDSTGGIGCEFFLGRQSQEALLVKEERPSST